MKLTRQPVLRFSSGEVISEMAVAEIKAD